MTVFSNRGRPGVMPRLNLRAGLLDRFWGEFGTDVAGDRLAGGTLLGGGAAFQIAFVSGHFGVGIVSRPMTDFGVRDPINWRAFEEGGDFSGYAQLTFHLGYGVGLNIGGIFGASPSFTGGLSYTF
jgi:hypothetical protein